MESRMNYERYVEEYNKQAAKHKMYAPMFNKETFEAAYRGMSNSMKAEGKRPLNITRKIVQRQAYELSYKQALSFSRARKNMGMEPMSVTQIRLLGKEKALDWDQVRSIYHAVKKAQGILQKLKNARK